MSSQSVIELHQVSKTVTSGNSDLTIVKDISLKIQYGESVAILGPSGSGKTTLLSLMAGLDLPTQGDIFLMGNNITKFDEDQRAELRRTNIGVVFQTFQLMPHFTALDNVMLPLELADIDNPNAVAKQWLEEVGLADRMTHLPKELSGGEQQRVAIARAFAIQPSILFADEPTGNLDTHSGEQIVSLLFELNANQGTTLVIVTHDITIASKCQLSLQLVAGKLQ